MKFGVGNFKFSSYNIQISDSIRQKNIPNATEECECSRRFKITQQMSLKKLFNVTIIVLYILFTTFYHYIFILCQKKKKSFILPMLISVEVKSIMDYYYIYTF